MSFCALLPLLVAAAGGFRLPASTNGNGYHWPSSRGRLGLFSVGEVAGPEDLQSSFSWWWHHPEGRFHTVVYNTLIDDQKNVYLSTDTSVWKLAPNGTAIWSWIPEWHETHVASAAALLDGRIHFATKNGRIWSLDMVTGKQVWSRKITHRLSKDIGFVAAAEGVVVAAINGTEYGEGGVLANNLVAGFRSSDGWPLWIVVPDKPTASFLPVFPGDDRVMFQDWEGKAYCYQLHTGKLLWKTGGEPGTWTNGSPALADGILYTVSGNTSNSELMEEGPDYLAPGFLTARSAKDGTLLWRKQMPMPPHNAPAVGILAGQSRPSVVQPAGYPGVRGGETGVFVFDAQTGQRQWSFIGPPQKDDRQAAVQEGAFERFVASCSEPDLTTTAWSAPMIDARGTVYLGHEGGLFYRLKDENGDGFVEGKEVVTFNTGSTFSGTSSPALAPGMLAVANTDTLYVFKASEKPEPLA